MKPRQFYTFQSSNPEDQGIDSIILEHAYAYLRQTFPALYDLLILRNGKAIFFRRNVNAVENDASNRIRKYNRWWARLWHAPQVTFQDEVAGLWNVRSVANSITALATGIAWKQGIIESLDAPILTYFPESIAARVNPAKQLITLRHLLTMTSGLASIDESWRARWLVTRRNWTYALLKLPLRNSPGTKFAVSSVDSYLLSAVITEITGQSLLEYASKSLFQPMQIQQIIWESGPEGVTYASSNLLMGIEDQAKIGQLVLQNGLWNNREVVSSEWIQDMLSSHQVCSPGWDYGYYWYLHDEVTPNGRRCPTWSAAGTGGQKILVIPDLELVLAANARTDFIGDRSHHLNQAISRYLMASFRE